MENRLKATYECIKCGAVIKSFDIPNNCECGAKDLKLIAVTNDKDKPLVTIDDETVNKTREKLRECYQLGIYLHDYYLDWDLKEIKLQMLWDISTYFYRMFDTFPYRYINAMKSSGKTRLNKITLAIAANAKLTTGMSDSALYRSAAAHTLIFDECENISDKDKNAQRLILNSGYKRGAVISLSKEKYVDKVKTYVTEDYDVYSPKMLSNINGMENVLEDRSITSIMERSNNPGKIKLQEDFDTNPIFLQLKTTLNELSVVWCMYKRGLEYREKWNSFIKSKYISTPSTLTTLNYTKLHTDIISEKERELFEKIDSTGLDGRHLELYFPLFIIANSLGEDILSDILIIAKEKTSRKKENDFMESKDISFIDFVSKLDPLRYYSISNLTSMFKLFFENNDTNLDWLNAHWMGKAFTRLNLISLKKRVSRGIDIMPNVSKAVDKLKMFKEDVPDGSS